MQLVVGLYIDRLMYGNFSVEVEAKNKYMGRGISVYVMVLENDAHLQWFGWQ